MFGSKREKHDRLEQLTDLVADEWRTQAELARATGVDRATVHKDLVVLEQRGVLLAEDERGRVRLFRRDR